LVQVELGRHVEGADIIDSVDDLDEGLVAQQVKQSTALYSSLFFLDNFLESGLPILEALPLHPLLDQGLPHLLELPVPLPHKLGLVHHPPICAHSTVHPVERTEPVLPDEVEFGNSPVEVFIPEMRDFLEHQVAEGIVELVLKKRAVLVLELVELVGGSQVRSQAESTNDEVL
jgi:hypothetical protein